MKQNDAAVSPVIGVILMVAITVILATVIAAIVFSFSADRRTERPTCAIKVDTISATSEIDFRIQHSGGDRLVSGQWRISIVPAGNSPIYRESSTNFNSGDQIITTNLTSGTGNYTVTNSAVYTTDVPPDQLISGGKYEVMIIVLPYRALVLDTIILAR